MDVIKPKKITDSTGVELAKNNTGEGSLISDGTNDRVLIGFQDGGFGNKNLGIKMSQEGYDVKTATDSQLIMSTAFNSFKIVQTGTVEVPSVTLTTNPDDSGSSSVAVGYDVSLGTPIVLAHVTGQGLISYVTNTYAGTGGTMVGADDATIGTVTWTNPNTQPKVDLSGSNITDTSVCVVKADASIGATDKASNQELQTATFDDYTYGSTSDLWGETWAYTDINDDDFGFVISYTSADSTNVSHYLRVDTFGFSIPSTATIVGIQLTINAGETNTSGTHTNGGFAWVQSIQADIWYSQYETIVRSPMQWEGHITKYLTDGATTSTTETYSVARTMSATGGALTFNVDAFAGSFGIVDSYIIFGPWTVRYYILQETAGT